MIAFPGFIALGVWLIARAARKAAAAAGYPAKTQNRIFYGILAFALAWAGYASALALSGFLYTLARPPRQVIFTTLPLVVLVLVLIPRTKLYKNLLERSRAEELIRIHIFRFAGAMFIPCTCSASCPRSSPSSPGPETSSPPSAATSSPATFS